MDTELLTSVSARVIAGPQGLSPTASPRAWCATAQNTPFGRGTLQTGRQAGGQKQLRVRKDRSQAFLLAARLGLSLWLRSLEP